MNSAASRSAFLADKGQAIGQGNVPRLIRFEGFRHEADSKDGHFVLVQKLHLPLDGKMLDRGMPLLM
jgi:hypothetical protein